MPAALCTVRQIKCSHSSFRHSETRKHPAKKHFVKEEQGCFAAVTCLWSVSLVYMSCICVCPVFFRLEFTHRSYIYIFGRRRQGHTNVSKYAGAFRTGSCSSSPLAFFHHMSPQKANSKICGSLNFSHILLSGN